MARFIKQPKPPEIVEAEQWFPGKRVEGVVNDDAPDAKSYVLCGCLMFGGPSQRHIHTEEGIYPVEAGDWIITEASGARHICRADEFAATYAEVDRPLRGERV